MKGIEQAQALDSRRFSCNLIPAAHLVPLLNVLIHDGEDLVDVVNSPSLGFGFASGFLASATSSTTSSRFAKRRLSQHRQCT